MPASRPPIVWSARSRPSAQLITSRALPLSGQPRAAAAWGVDRAFSIGLEVLDGWIADVDASDEDEDEDDEAGPASGDVRRRRAAVADAARDGVGGGLRSGPAADSPRERNDDEGARIGRRWCADDEDDGAGER